MPSVLEEADTRQVVKLPPATRGNLSKVFCSSYHMPQRTLIGVPIFVVVNNNEPELSLSVNGLGGTVRVPSPREAAKEGEWQRVDSGGP